MLFGRQIYLDKFTTTYDKICDGKSKDVTNVLFWGCCNDTLFLNWTYVYNSSMLL